MNRKMALSLFIIIYKNNLTTNTNQQCRCIQGVPYKCTLNIVPVVEKPVLEVSDQVMFKPASSATETS